MIEFKQGLPLYRFKKVEYTKTLERRVGQIFRQAIRAWIATMITRVPVKTGHARGTLIPLARNLRTRVPIQPKPGQKNKSSLGAAESMFVVKDDRSNPGQLLFSFEWEAFVLHFLLHDQGLIPRPLNSQIQPWPWNSTVYAQETMLAYLRTHLKGILPESVFKYVEKKYR